MGKNPKVKQAANGSHKNAGVKRKLICENEPPGKKQKEEKWYPGKFVLLKPSAEENVTGEASETSRNKSFESSIPTPTKNQKKRLKKRNKKLNGAPKEPSGNSKIQTNGKIEVKNHKKVKTDESVSQLEQLYARHSSESDDEWKNTSDSDDYESLSEDEEISEEWNTDTDYSEGDSFGEEEEFSFHGSDCESVTDDDDEDNEEVHTDYDSEDDSDFVPDIEDKYVKRGEAIMYEAKGLELAFGNSKTSQIVEVNDIAPAMAQADDQDDEEEIPELVAPDNDDTIDEEMNQSRSNSTVDELMSSEAEALIKDLQIDDDEDRLECLQLAKHATFHDCKDDQGVIVRLMNTIHFHGVLIVRAIANNVQINGYELKEKEFMTITSISRADYYLNLSPVVGGIYSKFELQKELKKYLREEEAANVLFDFNPKTEAIIHIQQGLPDSTLEMLKCYSPNPLLPNRKMILTNSPCPSSELILSAKFFVGSENQKISSYQANEQWDNIQMSSGSRLLVIGGKNVGKSGLCQFVINKNIETFKKILLIDLDIGQPICSVSQTVSATLITKPIIGPGYLSRNLPDKCILYGDKSVMIAPFKYVRCVCQLIEFCSANPDYKNIPWIINTMGYQKGFGLQLICLLIKILQPTDVIQIQHGVKSYNFSKILTEDVVNGFEFSFFDINDVAGATAQVFFTTHVLDSIVNNRQSEDGTRWISYASDKRKLSLLAQLAKLLQGNQTSLNDVIPFAAPINKIRMVVFDEEYSQQQQGFNMDLLNGNLVYLCQSYDDSPLSSSSILECHGVGIVRGIDKINQQIFILLPQVSATSQLQAKVNVLAIGNIPLPSEILLKQSYSIAGSIPHVTFFKDRSASSKKYVNKRNIKDCF